jgi:hypothetical protein
MVGHQTIRQEPHWHALTGLLEYGDEGLIIRFRMKDLGPGIAPIDHVVAIVSD